VCDCHPVSRQQARLTAGLLCLSFACGLPACGVSTEVYSRTLHERDQLGNRVKQEETEAAAQRRQADDLRVELAQQRQANHALQARVTELEAQTADQNLTQEALARQLRSVTVEREELLLKLDELKAPSPDSTATASSAGEAISRSEDADAQRLTGSLRDGIEAGHLTIHRLTHGLDLRLAESFVFVPDKTELTSEGQRLLSTIHTALSSIRLRRVLFRMPVASEAMEGVSELARNNRTTAFNRLVVLASQLGGKAESSELVLVAQREDAHPPPEIAASPEQAIPAGEIQMLLEWPVGP
jgi:chromosome segregation ATPase